MPRTQDAGANSVHAEDGKDVEKLAHIDFMSKAERLEKLRAKLDATEVEFRYFLVTSLHKCKDGGRGVFLTEAQAASKGDVYAQLVWPEAKQLEALGQEIDTLRQKLGEPGNGSHIRNIGTIAR